MPQPKPTAVLPALLTAAVLATGFAIPTFAQSPGTMADESSGLTAEQPFLNGNNIAMARMMSGMAITPTGDIDKDFVDMMVPHHQGAIDMAALELRYGHSERLKALAQEIIVTQQQEIAAMRLAVGEPLPTPEPSPVDPGATPTPSR